MHRGSDFNWQEVIDGEVLAKVEIEDGPNKWDLIINSLIKKEAVSFFIKMKDSSQKYLIEAVVVGVIKNSYSLLIDGDGETWDIVLKLKRNRFFEKIKVPPSSNNTLAVFYVGEYHSSLKHGDGRLFVFSSGKELHKPIGLSCRLSF